MDFPGGSAGKESACNTGDSSSISGLGKPSGEGISYSLQYSWAFLVVRMIKNPCAMRKTWVRSLGWEDPLEKGTATHSSILAWRIPWTEGAWQATVHGVTKSQTGLSDFHFDFIFWSPAFFSPVDSELSSGQESKTLWKQT